MSIKPNPVDPIVNALHGARFQPYLNAAGGNKKDALTLYKWHSELSSAVHSVLGVTEVVLRNAMDRELQVWNRAQPKVSSTASWLLDDPASPLRSISAGKRAQAIDQAQKARDRREPHHPRHQATVTHDDVLAQITFGLWKELLPNHQAAASNATEQERRILLWNQALHLAFPRIDDPTGRETFWRVYRLHQLRNRVSHMEPLLDADVNALMKNAFKLVGSIDAKVEAWVSGGSRVSAVLRQRPSR